MERRSLRGGRGSARASYDAKFEIAASACGAQGRRSQRVLWGPSQGGGSQVGGVTFFALLPPPLCHPPKSYRRAPALPSPQALPLPAFSISPTSYPYGRGGAKRRAAPSLRHPPNLTGVRPPPCAIRQKSSRSWPPSHPCKAYVSSLHENPAPLFFSSLSAYMWVRAPVHTPASSRARTFPQAPWSLLDDKRACLAPRPI